MKTQRPKWAKKLSAAQWRHLQEQQGTKRPTLTRLMLDVHHQDATGMTCWDCRAALNTVDPDEETPANGR